MKTCYVIMPFASEFEAVYRKGIQEAVAQVAGKLGESWRCIRADDIQAPGSINKEIITSLYTSDLVIADLSGNNPNVLYELGVAHSAGRITVMVTQNVESLPFDIHQYRTHQYAANEEGLRLLAICLSTAIVDALSGRLEITNPVYDNAPLRLSSVLANLQEVTRIEEAVRKSVWIIEPTFDTDLRIFKDVIRTNIAERGIEYRYLIPEEKTSLRQFQLFAGELGCSEAQGGLAVRIVEPHLVESEVVIYDAYTEHEEVMIMSPRERKFAFWYRVGRTRGEFIRDRFEYLWESASRPTDDSGRRTDK